MALKDTFIDLDYQKLAVKTSQSLNLWDLISLEAQHNQISTGLYVYSNSVCFITDLLKVLDDQGRDGPDVELK